MKAFIYCRVHPHNHGVAKSDRLDAQERRCQDFLRENNIQWVRTYKDEGEVNPVNLIASLNLMLDNLQRQENKTYVVSDHPARLGKDRKTQQKVIELIEQTGGNFIWPKPSLRYRSFTVEMMKALEGLS